MRWGGGLLYFEQVQSAAGPIPMWTLGPMEALKWTSKQEPNLLKILSFGLHSHSLGPTHCKGEDPSPPTTRPRPRPPFLFFVCLCARCCVPPSCQLSHTIHHLISSSPRVCVCDCTRTTKVRP